MDEQLKQWCMDGKHLPPIMRDFHDRKDIFKAMHELTNVEAHEYTTVIPWATGHCYIIDIFLWFMARHGYTLQRSRAKQNFEDLASNVEMCRKKREDAFAEMLKGRKPCSTAK